MSDKVNWLTHEFHILTMEDPWNDVGGIYIFAGVSPQNKWVAIYIGLAENFRNRMANHDRWIEAQRQGATHVHAKVVQSAGARLLLEKELIAAYQPPLNTHHR